MNSATKSLVPKNKSPSESSETSEDSSVEELPRYKCLADVDITKIPNEYLGVTKKMQI